MNETNSFQKMSKFVLDNPKIIKSIYRTQNYNDEPQLYQYSSQFIDGKSLKTSLDSTASGGTSFYRNSALLKLLGETIERYSLSTYDKNTLIYSSFKELVSNNENSLDPNDLSLLSQFIKRNKDKLNDIKFNWITGKSLTANRTIFVPAQLVFVPYSYSKSEPILQMPISTGAAAGETIYDAIYRGTCEVIERDSFMIHYYNKISSPQINLQALGSKKISKIISIFNRYKLELYVNDLTTDIGIPAVVAIIIDRTGMGPAVCVGLKAGFDMCQNVIGATEEALMVRSWIRDDYMYLKPKHNPPNLLRSIEERANFWCPKNTIHYLDFWLNAKNKKGSYKLHKFTRSSYKEKVTELIRIFEKKGYDVIYVDITAPKICKYGVKVVKVIIPRLQPLHLDEKYSYLTVPRMYSSPVNMGVFSKSKTLKELNHIPHPFL